MFSHSKRLADVTFYCRRRHVYRQKISFMIYFAMTERLPIWNCVFDQSSVVFNRISHFVNCDSNPDPRSHLVEGDEDSYLPYWRTKVASNTRGQQFESSPVIKNCYTGHLLSVNCIEKTKIKKMAGNGQIKNNYLYLPWRTSSNDVMQLRYVWPISLVGRVVRKKKGMPKKTFYYFDKIRFQ